MALAWQLLHALLLAVLNFYPYPELVIYPYLRSLGWLPYAQILDQHFPGLLFFPVNLHSLGFIDPSSLKALLILLVLLQSALIYKIAKHWLPVFLFTLWQPFFEGNQLWIETFLAVFTLPAWWFFSKKKWLLSGLFLGVGVVFKQTLIPLVILGGVYILYKYRRRGVGSLFWFGIGAILPSLVMLVHLWHVGVIKDFWYWTVKFNLTAYAAGGRLAPTLGQWVKLSWSLFIVGLAWWKLKHLRLLVGWILISSLGAVARFGFIHLQPAVPFFCLAYASLIQHVWRNNKLLAVVILVPSLVWTGWFYTHQPSFGGVSFYTSTETQIVDAITARTDPGDKIFLLGVNPHIYQLSDTVPPGSVFVFQFPWFLQVSGQRVLAGLMADKPKLIVYDPQSNIDGQYLKDYAAYLVDYTVSNYQPVQNIGSVIIYESRN